MSRITKSALPEAAFLGKYEAIEGGYTDCYAASLSQDVSLQAFIGAFFDTPVFRLERLLLRLFFGQRTSRADVSALAAASTDHLAAWRVEERSAGQVLLRVGDGPIRTWLMCEGASGETRLYFGSALLPLAKDAQGRPKMALLFRATLWFHQLYSRILLAATLRALRRPQTLRATT